MKQRVVIVIGAVVAVVLIAGWALLLYKPESDKLGSVQRQVEAEKAQETTLAAQLVKLQDLKEQEPQIDAELSRVKSLVPDAPDLSTYIREANRIATESGIDWLKVSAADPQASGDVTTVALDLELTGKYFNVVDYLTRVQELSRAVRFDSLQMSGISGDDGSSAGGVSVKLSGRMFSSGGGAPAPDAGGGAGSGARPTGTNAA